MTKKQFKFIFELCVTKTSTLFAKCVPALFEMRTTLHTQNIYVIVYIP